MNRRTATGWAQGEGFSLLELLLVLVILGLAITAVPPLLSGALPGLTLKGAVRDMKLALRETRSLSIMRNRPADLHLVPDESYYRVGGSPSRHRFAASLTMVLDGIQTEREPGSGVLRFFPDGSSSGGRITLSGGERRFRLEVDWLTGRITTREMQHGEG